MADELDLPPLFLSPRPSEPDVVDSDGRVQVQAVAPTERDSKYYFDFAVFLVEDHLYMVPKYQFTKATDFFTSMFEFAIDEETPIRLEYVEKVDFQAFLKLICPLDPMYEEPMLSQDEWVSVLKLASLWMMLDIRDMAIQALQPHLLLLPARKIVLAREYGVYEWLRTGYIHFATRQESLYVEDAIALGIDNALKLVCIREDSLQRNRDDSKRRNGPGVLDYTRTSLVDTEFSTELEAVRSAGTVDLVDRVVKAREYGMAEWLRSAYIALTERREVMCPEEAERLGLETTIQLCKVREASLRSYPMYLWDSPSAYERSVGITFKDELEGVRLLNDRYRRPVVTPVPSVTNQPLTPTKGRKKKKGMAARGER